MLKIAYLLLVVLLSLGELNTATADEPILRIAVASSFTPTLRSLIPLFEQRMRARKQTLRVQTSAASSGQLFAQIMHGAPFDIFLSADQYRIRQLIRQGRAQRDDSVDYAQGLLVLWRRDTGTVPLSEQLARPGHQIVLANPRTAPYGLAAKQVLLALKQWQNTQNRRIIAPSAAQVLSVTQVQQGALGFIAQSQWRDWQQRNCKTTAKNCGQSWRVPQAYYQPVRQSGVIIRHTSHYALAKQFMIFLCRADIQERIAAQGYIATRCQGGS